MPHGEGKSCQVEREDMRRLVLPMKGGDWAVSFAWEIWRWFCRGEVSWLGPVVFSEERVERWVVGVAAERVERWAVETGGEVGGLVLP